MEFKLSLPQSSEDFTITHSDPILLTGSCFAENVGKKLAKAKFIAKVNPLGIAYNPISIHKNLSLSKPDSDIPLIPFEDYFVHPDFHSKFNAKNKALFIKKVQSQIDLQASFFKNCNYLFISYGTSWVYESIESGQIVNNCHKIPAKKFIKRLLNKEEITDSFQKLKDRLKEIGNKNFKIIITVSPVRHLKDGWHENQLSKSTLMLAVNDICNKNKDCYYFPSYELMIDDLRDYRFYDKDLVHPNEQAIEYIWEYFKARFFNEELKELIVELDSLYQSLNHKPFQRKSKAHQTFLTKLLQKIRTLESKTNLDFNYEINQIQGQLN